MTALEHFESADRARVYRTLAGLFRAPDDGLVERLQRVDLPQLRKALYRLGGEDDLLEAAECVARLLDEAQLQELTRSYNDTFDASGGLRCSPHETSHAPDTPQEALVRTFQLADIAGFYRAFGVEVMPETERVDHISAELEFMHLLAVKAAMAKVQHNPEGEEICRDAAGTFLRDHLSRWYPRFCRSLEEASTGSVYAAAARLLERFLNLEMKRVAGDGAY